MGRKYFFMNARSESKYETFAAMKKIHLVLLFALFVSYCHAQKSDSVLNRAPFIIKYDIVRLLPDVLGMKYGCICFGFESHLNMKNSIGIDFGFITDYGPTKENGIGNISAKSIKGYYSNVEYRHYYKSTNRYKFYYGINLSYQKTKTERQEILVNSSNYLMVITSSNNYFVGREVIATHFKAGIKKQFHHFVFDPEIGLGLRNIKSHTEHQKGAPDHTYELPYNKVYDSGEKLVPSFNYNLKIGWMF